MREHWWERAGARLCAVELGEGPSLVMLHGGMATHVAALPLVQSLGDRYRVLTPDQRGSGRSIWGGPLTFDLLADDLAALLDRLAVERAVIGGVSGGTGVAVRFALRHANRTAALVLVKPVYAGADRGYTPQQAQAFVAMDAVAGRALDEGIQVLRPLYAGLPSPMREKALAMLEGLDPASVVATSRFIASGAQPFATAGDLTELRLPVLLVRGDDALHPAEVSDLYAAALPRCRVLPATADVPAAIAAFCTAETE